jgi:two-component system sensor histidine kinase HydH
MTPHHPPKRQKEVIELREELAAQESLATLGLAWMALQHRLSNTVRLLLPLIVRLKARVEEDDQGTLEIVESLERTANQVDAILNRLNLLVPSEAKFENQDVNTLLYEVGQELVSTLVGTAAGNVTINYWLSDEVPTIKTDAGLLKEVFRNLVENGLKAIALAGGAVELSTHYLPEMAEVRIEIKDTGSGIPPDLRDRLFLQPIEKKSAGPGLGLWLSRLILARLGGSIQVAQTQVGMGTTMVVTLPVVR